MLWDSQCEPRSLAVHSCPVGNWQEVFRSTVAPLNRCSAQRLSATRARLSYAILLAPTPQESFLLTVLYCVYRICTVFTALVCTVFVLYHYCILLYCICTVFCCICTLSLLYLYRITYSIDPLIFRIGLYCTTKESVLSLLTYGSGACNALHL